VTAVRITNVRAGMRGSPGHGVWYEGVADLREAEPRPGDPDNWLALVETVRCSHRHADSQTATKCAKKTAQARLDGAEALF
jgi:hypothetical protein